MTSDDDRDINLRGKPSSLNSLLQSQQSDRPEKIGNPKSANKSKSAKSLQQLLMGDDVESPSSRMSPSHQNLSDTYVSPGATHVAKQLQHSDSVSENTRKNYTTGHSKSLPGLVDLLRPETGGGGTGQSGKKTSAHRTTKVSLDDAIRVADDSTTKESNNSSFFKTRSKFFLIVSGSLLIILVTSLFSIRNKSAPDSEVARRLLVVAEDVARYQAQNNRLPERLSTLPSFPKDAVEWPIENYAVQLASPKLEFFFVDVLGGYIVIARYAEETWYYDNASDRPLNRHYEFRE